MIQLSSLMWVAGIFFALLGFIRGWGREVVATAGILLALFALFQFDSILRGTLFILISPTQSFFVQAAIFSVIAYIAYQARGIVPERRGSETLQSGVLGGLFGFFNGYLIAGSLWYFMDINGYPLTPYVTAPSINSPSAQSLSSMPIVMLSGGVSGTGDILTVIVIVLIFIVVAVAL